MFVAIDLNKLHFVDLANIDAATLMSQQKAMKDDLTAVLSEKEKMHR